MKAITLHAPWATLLVTRQPCHIEPHVLCSAAHPMVARFITSAKPCPPSIIGQRVAFHQGKRRPRHGAGVGDFECNSPAGTHAMHLMDYREDGREWTPRTHVLDLPLGAIVGSGVTTASLPIRGQHPASPFVTDYVLSIPDAMVLQLWVNGEVTDISDQLPYGDWTPGRYAWLIEDAAPTTERCPWCWGEGLIDGVSYPTDYGTGIEYDATPCPVCSAGDEAGPGRCDPISATGRQGFFEWGPR